MADWTTQWTRYEALDPIRYQVHHEEFPMGCDDETCLMCHPKTVLDAGTVTAGDATYEIDSKIAAIGVVIDAKIVNLGGTDRKWRCTHGHRWTHAVELVGVQIGGALWGMADGESLKFCPLCIREKLLAGCGQVREDL